MTIKRGDRIKYQITGKKRGVWAPVVDVRDTDWPVRVITPQGKFLWIDRNWIKEHVSN